MVEYQRASRGSSLAPSWHEAGGAWGRTIYAVAIIALSAGFFWLVWLYGNGLRDARYLDGWVLAAGMGLQLGYHVAVKTARLAPRLLLRWRKVHVFAGYLLIAAFVSHSDLSLPDTALEWALWSGFLLVSLSGVFGTYVTWSLEARHGIDRSLSLERIQVRRAELARDVLMAVRKSDRTAIDAALPAPPSEAWIEDFYTSQLRPFFECRGQAAAHLIGSQRPLKQLVAEIGNLNRFADRKGQEKLAAIEVLVIEKHRLDFARVQLGLARGWLFVHVPVTYALIVLSVLHVAAAYAFSQGAM